jgi:hypothetical protein
VVAGQASGTLGSGAAYLKNPNDVLIDINNNIYVCDKENHRVQFWMNGASTGSSVAGTGKQSIFGT